MLLQFITGVACQTHPYKRSKETQVSQCQLKLTRDIGVQWEPQPQAEDASVSVSSLLPEQLSSQKSGEDTVAYTNCVASTI